MHTDDSNKSWSAADVGMGSCSIVSRPVGMLVTAGGKFIFDTGVCDAAVAAARHRHSAQAAVAVAICTRYYMFVGEKAPCTPCLPP
jgi:hypothetical protein